VYTPYYKSFRKRPVPAPVKKLSSLSIPGVSLDSIEIEELALIPTVRWDQTIQKTWDPTEQGAHHVLAHFLKKRMLNYDNGRDFPGNRYVSEFSPYLAFGQFSVRSLYHYLLQKMDKTQNNKFPEQAESFIKQLIWREFSYHILYHFPHSIKEPLNERFKTFAWEKSESYYKAWKEGKTGDPLVDAGMRELWATGYMHNRVRMIVGSFLVKHLLIHWKEGEKWFWDTLVDADLANNTFGWQWASGSGADAAPYFRIFNPTVQGERFDKEGNYVKKWIPELKHLPKRYLHKPWEAPAEVLKEACIELGKDYPHPVVDHKEARERALQRYDAVKSS
jgi:deoxyribodipyrimidine photo-lyase